MEVWTYDREKIVDEINENLNKIRSLDYKKDMIEIEKNGCKATIRSLFKYVLKTQIEGVWLCYNNNTYFKLKHVNRADPGYSIHVVYKGDMGKNRSIKINIDGLPTVKCVKKMGMDYASGTEWMWDCQGIPERLVRKFLENVFIRKDPNID